LGKSAAVIAGGVVLPRTALSYENIVGANDRISLGHIGIGSRGGDIDLIASKLKSSHHVEMTAVCDLWKVNREKATATNAGYYGRAPRDEGCRWGADFHARACALADPETGSGGGQRRLCRKANGQPAERG
jgi:hypothetical protein